jgi:hypothetical protein
MRYLVSILIVLIACLFFIRPIDVKAQLCGTGQFQYVRDDECHAANWETGCNPPTYTQSWSCYTNSSNECVMNYTWRGCYVRYDSINDVYYCNPEENQTTLPCGYASGGGSGGSYVYTKCPTGTSLSCGSQTEAEEQNKSFCTANVTCSTHNGFEG